MKRISRSTRIKLAISIPTGAIAGAAFVFIGTLHNAQSEFQLSNGDFDFFYATKVFLSWFLLVSIICFLLLSVFANSHKRR